MKGREFSRALLDPYTDDWQELAKEVMEELNALYRRSALAQSFDHVVIEAFSPGSIIVDYYVVFNQLLTSINTQDLKDIVADQTKMPDREVNMLGSLQIDPKRIDFIVVGTQEPLTSAEEEEDNMLLPAWGVAVVVIGLASVAFVIVFGVSMLVKKRRIAQGRGKGGKQAISLTEEMVYEMNRNGSTGYSGLDAAYHNYGLQGGDMESWKSDKFSAGRQKRGSSSSSGGGTERHGRGPPGGEGPYQSGLYDSWKTEWNPTYRDYQTTHYPHATSSYMTKGGRRPSYEDDF